MCLWETILQAQTDSVHIGEVQINALAERRDLLQLPSTASVLDSAALQMPLVQSLLPAMNNLARSPLGQNKLKKSVQ